MCVCVCVCLCLKTMGSFRCVVFKILDRYLIVSKFELQSCYCIPFWTNALTKDINSVFPGMG